MQSVGRSFWRVVDFPFRIAAYGLIQTYRYTLSAFMGRNCRHAPSCSEFTRDAIWRFGFWPGGWMGLARIVRCRPGGTHGFDPVPETVPADARWYLPWQYGRWKGEDMPAGTKRRTDTSSRAVGAEPARVYTALADPDQLVQWLPPAGMSGRIEAYDLKPGGHYRMVLTYADAAGARPKSSDNTDVVEGRFVELMPGRRLVQAIDFVSDDPAFAGTMTMSWMLERMDEGTQVTVIAENVPEGISAADHGAGLRSSLANLAAFVEPPA